MQKIQRSLGVLSMLGLLSACTSEEQKAIQAGAELYQQNCKVCHAQGINGAPIVGNQKMWAKRVAQGEDVLVQHAMEGFGLMPAKGGNESLTETEIRQVVKFYLSELDK